METQSGKAMWSNKILYKSKWPVLLSRILTVKGNQSQFSFLSLNLRSCQPHEFDICFRFRHCCRVSFLYWCSFSRPNLCHPNLPLYEIISLWISLLLRLLGQFLKWYLFTISPSTQRLYGLCECFYSDSYSTLWGQVSTHYFLII